MLHCKRNKFAPFCQAEVAAGNGFEHGARAFFFHVAETISSFGSGTTRQICVVVVVVEHRRQNSVQGKVSDPARARSTMMMMTMVVARTLAGTKTNTTTNRGSAKMGV